MKSFILTLSLFFLIIISGYSQNFLGLTAKELRDEYEQDDLLTGWSHKPKKDKLPEYVTFRDKETKDVYEYQIAKGVVNKCIIVTNITKHYLYVNWLNKTCISNDFNLWIDYKSDCKWTSETDGEVLRFIATPLTPNEEQQKPKKKSFLSFS